METAFQKLKVHNEIEWCEVTDPAVKERIEKELLKNRVSYCISWSKPGFFSAERRAKCTFLVNQLQKDTADEAMDALPDEMYAKIHFTNKKVEKVYY